jgi:hypothetical protein
MGKAIAYGLPFEAGIPGILRRRAGRFGRLSVGNPPIGSRRGQGIRTVSTRLQTRQHRRGGLDIHGPRPGVAAGQLQARMPHELLDHPGGNPGGIGQRRRFAPQCWCWCCTGGCPFSDGPSGCSWESMCLAPDFVDPRTVSEDVGPAIIPRHGARVRSWHSFHLQEPA